ncbi:MAG: TonB-dependent receptor [Bacteroidota bacterium]|nr:TonB-dependent receptor [Bacteroidota bacterium]
MKKIILWVILLTMSLPTFSQNIFQVVRGKVSDSEIKTPLPGASIVLLSDTSTFRGTTTDDRGVFRMDQVPVGRHSFKVTFVGYKETILHNIIVTSAKEVVLNIDLQESAITLTGVSVSAQRSGEAQNEMATVSARAFTVDETDRYAGSRGDPARMASNFAGVQGADDSRNDIVVRGNSPQGVLWQVEGINIPNPNHFAIPGTGGGPVSILNNKILANSDFFTGAFPAEFGNSIAGVFDLKMRNGNNQKNEFSGQLGFLGTELFGEGPISRAAGSSFMFSYRYSTLSLFSALGIDIGTSAIPKYQDASFRLNFPLRGGGSLAVFGVGGTSKVDIMISDQEEPERNVYGENDRDQYFASKMGFGGITLTKPLFSNSVLKATLAASTEIQDSYHEYIYRHVSTQGKYVVDSLSPILDYTFNQQKFSGIISWYTKINNRNSVQLGINNDLHNFNFIDSVNNINPGDPDYYQWRVRWDAQETALLSQPYVQWKHRFNDFISLTAGVHSQFFSLNNSFSPFEPRLGLHWALPRNQAIALGMGVHSQLQPTYIYFYAKDIVNGQLLPHNKELGFTKSNHYVFSYEKVFGNNIRFKAETYYQHLYDVPVTIAPSSFSLLNTGAGFTRFFPEELVNEGTGKNYGIEFTMERFFSRGYFFLVTTSLLESKFKGSDGILRDTDFNGNYALNTLFTKEFKIGTNSSISLGTNVTAAGGRRYGPVDLEASLREKDVIFVDATRNTLQLRDYFRADLRVNYRLNRPRVTHEIAIDFVNVFNTKNILKLTFAPNEFQPQNNPVREEYQLGFLPLFYYKIDF